MRNITLDTNCLLDLEENTERAFAVRYLIDCHDSGEIVLSVPAIMASERQRGGVYLEQLNDFTSRLTKLGVVHLPHLIPMMYFGIGFWDYGLYADDESEALERRIHEVLHPDIEFDYSKYCLALHISSEAEPLERRWRNAKCDVQVLWTHIHHGGDLLVTNDQNFTKESKLPKLLALGAGAIAKTADAPAALRAAP